MSFETDQDSDAIYRHSLDVGVLAILENFANGQYDQLAAAATPLIERGRDDASSMVAVQMIVDGTLAILNLPHIAESLPTEISQRSRVAGFFSTGLSDRFVEHGTFVHQFESSPTLAPLLTDRVLTRFTSKEYMTPLGAAVFGDSCFSMGGAHRFITLERQKGRFEDDEPISNIIKRSTGLLAIAGMARNNYKKTWTHLGFPYILNRHLQHSSDRSRPTEVQFTDSARRFLSTVTDTEGGCPAARIPNPDGVGTTLTRAWNQVAEMLVPENATSQERPRKLPKE